MVPHHRRALRSTITTRKESAVDGHENLQDDVPLIPRKVLFGNPRYTSPRLSPDGTFLAYLAPSPDREILNVFVQPIIAGTIFHDVDGSTKSTATTTTARQVTNDTNRGIRFVQWGEDSRTILYLQDCEGDENFHLFAVDTADPDAKEARDLTPGKDVKCSSIVTNKRYPNQILLGTNQRDAAVFDMYTCDLETGELRMDTQNPGDVVSWGVEDESYAIRMAMVRNAKDSSTTIRVRDDKNSVWRDLVTFPYGEEGGFVDFCAPDAVSGKVSAAYITSTLDGRDTKALLKVDLQSGEVLDEIASNPRCDVRGITVDEDTKQIKGVSYNYARTERVVYDKELDADYRYLESIKPKGSEVSAVSKTRDKTLWVAVFSRSDGPSEYFLFDRVQRTTTPLFVSQPELLQYALPVMDDVRIPARDGLELVGYLVKTPLVQEHEPAPLVLLVHGGPWARDFWGFNAQAQWFANRGYSCLKVNFRGSSGYGKAFLHKGDMQWGVGDMQHDLTDSVNWAIEKEIALPDKICIYGGSYGGYACLAGLTFTPDLYACGVDIVGPSNCKTLLDSMPAYWGPMRNDLLRKIGDVDNDADFNQRISPLFHVDKIKAPLLIGQGKNDPRVKQAEADQIAFTMHKKGIPVEYVLYPDEGHGFARPENRIDFNGRVELFLQKHLGGRSEQFVQPEGSKAQFPLVEQDQTKNAFLPSI
jgi:dipeptidyl aminopeptidase/acylaminoacyl peptidase